MAISFSNPQITIDSGTETLASIFADAFNSPSGDSGTYVNRIPTPVGYRYRFKTVRIFLQAGAVLNITEDFTFTGRSVMPYLRVSGTLNIGAEQTLYGLDFSSKGITGELECPNLSGASNAFNYVNIAIAVHDGGQLNVYGSRIVGEEGGLIYNRHFDDTLADGASITLVESNFIMGGVLTAAATLPRVGIGSDCNISIERCQFSSINGTGEVFVNTSGSISIAGYTARHLTSGFTFNEISGKTLSGLDVSGCLVGIAGNTTTLKTNIFLDSPAGNATPVGAKSGVPTALFTSILAITLTLLARSGGTTVNPKIHLEDTNNGQRAQAMNSGTYAANRVYTGQLSAGSLVLFPYTGIYEKVTGSVDPVLDDRLPLEGTARLYGYRDFGISITSDLPVRSPIPMVVDPLITLSEIDAGNLTGVTIDHDATLLTLASSKTSSEIYDRHAWDLFQDANIITTLREPWFTSSDGFNFINNYDLTFSGTADITAGSWTMGASTTVALGARSSYAAKLQIPATGTVVVQPGTTDLSAFTFSAGSILSLTSGTATVIVASDPGIVTAGAGTITIQTPQASLTAPNFADGVRFYAERHQTFSVQSADINTGTDEITLGTDAETGAAFAGQATAPRTLSLLILADGATIPTTSPQIVSGNLYYVVANSVGVIQLSETDGGAAIDWVDAGTESGGQLLTLITKTELLNQLISGGSGLNEALTLPSGAVIGVAAQDRPSTASASILFERTLVWNTTSGAAIADTFSATNNPDLIHDALVGASITSSAGNSITITSDGASVVGLAFDISGNIELDANAITDSEISFPDGYLWMLSQRYTETGIRFIRNQFTAIGIMDYRFNGLTIDNTADGVRNSPATTLTVVGNILPSTSGQPVVASGSGTIHIIPFFNADLTSAGDGSFTAADRTNLTTLFNATTAGTGTTVFSAAALANAPSGGGGGGDDAATIYTYFTSSNREDVFKATGFAVPSDIPTADIADILADTNELQTDWVNGGRLDILLDAIPNTTAFEARTLPSQNYFNPTLSAVNVGQIAGQSALASGVVDFDQLSIITDGVPKNNAATGQVVTHGAVASGSYLNTATDDGVYFAINPNANGIDIYLEFQIGSNFPNALTLNAKYDAQNNRFTNLFAYDWEAGEWDQISDATTRLNHSVNDVNYGFPLTSKYRNGAGSIGEVRIRFVSSDTNTGYQLDLDQVLLSSVSAVASAAEIAEAVRARQIENTFRQGNGVSVDTVNGVTGTNLDDTGIPQRPVNNLADAIAIASNTRLNTKTLYLLPGSSIILDRTFENWQFLGTPSLWTVDLGGQVLTGSAITNARVNGTGLSTGNRIRFSNCVIFSPTLGNAIFENDCVLIGKITMINGADHSYRGAFGKGVAQIDFNNPTSLTNAEFLNFTGPLIISNMNANCSLFLAGNGQLVFNNCTGGSMVRAGAFSYTGDESAITVTDATVEEIKEGLEAQGLTTVRTGYLDQLPLVKTKTDQLAFTGTDIHATLDGEQVVASNMRGTDGALTSFSGLPNVTVGTYAAGQSPAEQITVSDLALEATAQACLSAATALADGRYIEAYPDATGTIYDANGNVRTVFDLFQADGTTPATGPENAAERRPR